ncbi:Eukaryotic translation initiation factor 4E [Trichinella britovi]|uniref:Eukaryotic translation initiation factor 4E n=2 Tax=Trichinella TaxID=6333 RepID=A0A0V1DIS7_TRIBR|nr:Eukaryotic translation initiation factor 4E [Trichinella murrelli]KRY61361.1 Eukaryotic translation initiation factor 4E [Trichinella britovi]KRZ98051.1 Eukaryotic translation initiation factor 4E [Trichinella sp. T8]
MVTEDIFVAAEETKNEICANQEDVDASQTKEIPKHPLQNTWVIWFNKRNPHSKSKSENSPDSGVEVASFSNVEDFWAIYNFIQKPSMFKSVCDFNIFKKGIRPTWKDKKTEGISGRWTIRLDNPSPTYVDQLWLELLMAMLGEQFGEYGEHIDGAAFNIRNGIKLNLWTSLKLELIKEFMETEGTMNGDIRKQIIAAKNEEIGKLLKDKLNVHENVTWEGFW